MIGLVCIFSQTLLDIVGSNLGIIESRIDNLSPASRQQAELQLQKIDIQVLFCIILITMCNITEF